MGKFRPTLAAGAAVPDAVELFPVTAAIYFNDTLAIGALSRFERRGVRVPDDMSVIGCDDIFGAWSTNPPLTTVTAAGEETGRAITDILVGVFTSKDRLHRLDRFPPRITVRESTDSPKSEVTSATS